MRAPYREFGKVLATRLKAPEAATKAAPDEPGEGALLVHSGALLDGLRNGTEKRSGGEHPRPKRQRAKVITQQTAEGIGHAFPFALLIPVGNRPANRAINDSVDEAEHPPAPRSNGGNVRGAR